MSVESERKRIWHVFNDDNCYPDEMMKAIDLDRLILEVRAEMACMGEWWVPYSPTMQRQCPPHIMCPSCVARANLTPPVTA